MSIFGWIKKTASKAVSKASDVIGGAVSKVESAVKTIYKDSKSAVSSIHDDIKQGVAGGVNYIEHTQDKFLDTVSHVADDATEVGKSLSWPLIIVGGVIALYFLEQKN